MRCFIYTSAHLLTHIHHVHLLTWCGVMWLHLFTHSHMAWYVVLTYMVTHSCASLVMRFLSCTVVRYYVYNSACLSTCLFTTNYVTFFSLPSLSRMCCAAHVQWCDHCHNGQCSCVAVWYDLWCVMMLCVVRVLLHTHSPVCTHTFTHLHIRILIHTYNVVYDLPFYSYTYSFAYSPTCSQSYRQLSFTLLIYLHVAGWYCSRLILLTHIIYVLTFYLTYCLLCIIVYYVSLLAYLL